LTQPCGGKLSVAANPQTKKQNLESDEPCGSADSVLTESCGGKLSAVSKPQTKKQKRPFNLELVEPNVASHYFELNHRFILMHR